MGDDFEYEAHDPLGAWPVGVDDQLFELYYPERSDSLQARGVPEFAQHCWTVDFPVQHRMLHELRIVIAAPCRMISEASREQVREVLRELTHGRS